MKTHKTTLKSFLETQNNSHNKFAAGLVAFALFFLFQSLLLDFLASRSELKRKFAYHFAKVSDLCLTC